MIMPCINRRRRATNIAPASALTDEKESVYSVRSEYLLVDVCLGQKLWKHDSKIVKFQIKMYKVIKSPSAAYCSMNLDTNQR